MLRAKQMDELCHHHCDEYIYQLTYKLNMTRYDHYREDLWAFGNNAEEMIRQVIATCVWVYEYHKLTGRMLEPYLPLMLGSLMPSIPNWRTLTLVAGCCPDFHDDMKKKWQYLVTTLQFWMDNNVTVRIRGGPVHPMSPLAHFIKETANLVLPDRFHLSWKHVVEDMPWYRYRDYIRLEPVSPSLRNRLEKGMRLFHEKVDDILKKQAALHNQQTYWSPDPKVLYTREADEPHHDKEQIDWSAGPNPIGKNKADWAEKVAHVDEGQFDNDDLDEGVFNLLETLTDTPVQDEVITMATIAEEVSTTDKGNSVKATLSFQEKRRLPTFSSPIYRQEEIAQKDEQEHVPGMPELLPPTPGGTPGVTPRVTPRTMPQTSPKHPSLQTPCLRGCIRGGGSASTGRGRGILPEEELLPRE